MASKRFNAGRKKKERGAETFSGYKSGITHDISWLQLIFSLFYALKPDKKINLVDVTL